jgi:hypothetical protein
LLWEEGVLGEEGVVGVGGVVEVASNLSEGLLG